MGLTCRLHMRLFASCLLVLTLASCTQNATVEVIYQGQPSAEKGIRTVVVGTGDSLSHIALRYRVDLAALINVNNMRPPFTIYPGQVLRLPPVMIHTVRQGETLSGIASQYGVAVQALVRENGLLLPYRPSPGRKLRLPATTEADPKTDPDKESGIKSRSQADSRKAAPGDVHTPPRRLPGAKAGTGFQWPVKGKILSRYGWLGKGRFNDGINIAARRGTPVRAADDGIVAYAGTELTTLGNLLLIKHKNGWISTYAHNDQVLVRSGDRVKRGQIVARVGSTGQVSRPQLHFQLRRGVRSVNPERYL